MSRLRFRDFSRGWWPVGPASEIPRNALREAMGVRPFYGQAIKSRYGNPAIATIGTGVQSMYVWNGEIFFSRIVSGVGRLSRVSLSNTTPNVIVSNLGGAPLRFAAGIPTPDVDVTKFQNRDPSHLFVVGGGQTPAGIEYETSVFPLRKIDRQFRVSPIGLDPPQDNFQVGTQGPITILIDTFDIAGAWGGHNTSGAPSSSTIKQVGTFSTKVMIATESTGYIERNRSINLGRINTNFNGVAGTTDSVKQDWIRLWVFCDKPENLEKIDLLMDCGGPDSVPTNSEEGWDKTFSYSIFVADSVLDTTIKAKGITDFEAASDKRETKPFYPGGSVRPTTIFGSDETEAEKEPALSAPDVESIRAVSEMATTKLSPTANTWTLLRIPKMLFEASTEDMQKNHPESWSRLRRVRLAITTNDGGPVNVHFDQMDLHLGFGLQGDYKTALTLRNSTTGTRSRPTAIKEVKNVLREALVYSNITVSGESANFADEVEIWRTLGNGNVLFFDKRSKLASLTNAQIFSFTSDYEGMQEPFTIPGIGPYPELKLLTLPEDNVRYPRLTSDIAGPHLGRFFLLVSKEEGRVYYTPPGRLESVAGFIDVTSYDNPLCRVVYWHTVYAIGDKQIFELQGNQEPFLFKEVFGVPGTIYPDSVVVTPYGIVYYENDGVRLFNGSTSELIAIDAVASYFQSEGTRTASTLDSTAAQATLGRLAMFGGYHEGEYFLSDGLKTLAVNLRTGVWRTLGVGFGPMGSERTFGHMVAMITPYSTTSKLSLVEISSEVRDDGVAIPFEVELPATVLEDQSGVTKLVQRVYFDLKLGINTVNATLLTTGAGGIVNLGSLLASPERQIIEISLCEATDIMGIRLTGNLIAPFEFYGWDVDHHQPEEGGSTT